MTDKKLALFLVLAIAVFSGLLIFVLDVVGIINTEKWAILAPKNPEKIEDLDYPSEVDKMEFEKLKEKLLEKEEELAQLAEQLTTEKDEIEKRKKELDDIRLNIEEKEEFLRVKEKDFKIREKKVQDLAMKVTSMEPEKATEMMVEWTDFDIIDVMRQIDKNAEAEGVPSIVPYLLTLFTPERRAEITRKMLLPPVEQE